MRTRPVTLTPTLSLRERETSVIRRALLTWYDRNRRALPWRFAQDNADPYRVWIAEAMLQQTQVVTVIPYYQRFIARFPTLAALAAAPDDDVLALWSGLGYYARCRNLLAAARRVMAVHGGELPRSVEALRELPGFGPYTAGAVASIAYAVRAPIVDGNVARVLARLCAIESPPEQKETRARLWMLATKLVPENRPGDFNQALMELGATVCTKGAPQCVKCPLGKRCAARREGKEAVIPLARTRAEKTRLLIACALIERKGKLLFVKGESRGLFGGLWSVPGCSVASKTSPARALTIHLRTLGLDVAPAKAPRVKAQQTLTHRELTLLGFRFTASAPARRRRDWRWLAASELSRVGVSSASAKLLRAHGWRFNPRHIEPSLTSQATTV